MRLSISFKVPKEMEKSFGKTTKEIVREFKKRVQERMQPVFEKTIDDMKEESKNARL